MRSHKKTAGFTIVELLVVIVVIAILAAITIVAYSGVTARAKLTVLKSDLSGAYETLEIYNTTNAVYPPNLASAALKASPGTTYQYTYTNSSNSYCLTGSNNNISYNITNTSNVPTSGACPGDVNGGVAAITNLAWNPNADVSATHFSSVSMSGAARTAISDLSGFNYAYGGTTTADGSRIFSTNSASGAQLDSSGATTYGYGVWVKATAGTSITLQVTDGAGAGAISVNEGAATGSWQRFFMTFTPSSASYRLGVRQVGAGTNSLLMTGVMLTTGTTQYNFADGDTSGWSWTGTQYESNSTGQPV